MFNAIHNFQPIFTRFSPLCRSCERTTFSLRHGYTHKAFTTVVIFRTRSGVNTVVYRSLHSIAHCPHYPSSFSSLHGRLMIWNTIFLYFQRFDSKHSIIFSVNFPHRFDIVEFETPTCFLRFPVSKWYTLFLWNSECTSRSYIQKLKKNCSITGNCYVTQLSPTYKQNICLTICECKQRIRKLNSFINEFLCLWRLSRNIRNSVFLGLFAFLS